MTSVRLQIVAGVVEYNNFLIDKTNSKLINDK